MNIPHNDSCSQTVDQHPVTQSHLYLAKCNLKVFEVSPVQHAFLAFVRGGQPSERRACEWLQAGLNQFRVYVKLLVCPLARIDLKAKQTVTILPQEIKGLIYARYVPTVKVVDKASWDTFAVPNVKPSCTPPSQYASVCQWQDTVLVVLVSLPFWCKGSVFDVFDAILISNETRSLMNMF